MKTRNALFAALFVFLLLFFPLALNAQEDFGFGDQDFGFGESDSGAGFFSPPRFSVSLGGEVRAELKLFYDDLSSGETFKNIQLGDIFSGSLSFDAAGSMAEGYVKLNLVPVFDAPLRSRGSSPVALDEAFVRAFFGPVTITGGLKKLTWGKADSFGPLDLVNPLDYSDLSKISDPQSVKLARPMIHASWSMGSFSKLEAVFVPWFQGHKFATSGRWVPGQIDDLRAVLEVTLGQAAIIAQGMITDPSDPTDAGLVLLNKILTFGNSLESSILDGSIFPSTDTLKYAQAGTRFTTTLGSSDLGFQYYFGRFPRPVVSGLNPMLFISSLPTPNPNFDALVPDINYNYYHHIGVDYAQVIFGFNVRAEAGANITADLDGTDGTIENPALLWSLGFDRDLFWNINLNLQGNGRIRLFQNQISDNPLVDCEAGTKASSTRITGILSRKFLRDELEIKISALWGIEDKDFFIAPALSWARNDVKTELSAGFFGGDKKGELGQYKDNSFLRIALSYKF